jgi:acetoin utilization protein AcuC
VSSPTLFLYHPRYDGRGFSRVRDSWRRYALARELLVELGLFDGALRWVEPTPATDDEILLVHDPAYLAFVKERDAAGTGFLDYGDTPAYPGVLFRARVAVGATLAGARAIARGEAHHAFNPGGGLHHAGRARAGGFCVFNDVVIAVRVLQRELGVERIAIVDLDGHHGDGTQELFWDEPILYASLHRHGGRFYPQTGAATEVGAGRGLGYTLNVPLARGTGNAAYLRLLDEVVLPYVAGYRPDFLIVQIGVDTHCGDPLVRLDLTAGAYREIALRLHALAHDLCGGRLLAVAGGGYVPEAVARCWAIFLGTLAGPFADGTDPRLERLLDLGEERPRRLSAHGSRADC